MADLSAERISRKMNKLINEVSGYVYRAEHEFEMPIDEERIAIMAALGAMTIAVGQLCSPAERQFAQRLAKGAANAISKARNGSAHVGAPGTHQEFKP